MECKFFFCASCLNGKNIQLTYVQILGGPVCLIVDEKAGAVLYCLNDRLVQFYRNCGAPVAAAYIPLGINKRLTYIVSAVHYNSPAVSIIINALFKSL